MLRLFVLVFSVIAMAIAQSGEGPEPLFTFHVEDVSHIRPLNDLDYLLPRDTHPINYNIELWTKVDEEDFNFQGTVEIEIKVNVATNTIVIHKRNSTITEMRLSTDDRLNVLEVDYEYDELYEFLRITTKDDVVLESQERYFLFIAYESELQRTQSRGFYLDQYVDEAGKTMYLATTHFEATSARHAFPCYDEPALKATFQIKINHGCGFKAYSNMPESFDRDEDNKCSTSFEKTPVMSSYLIAFVVADYDFRENYDGPITKDRLKHRIITRSRYIENDVALPLQWSEEILNDLAAYTQTAYDLPKIDQIGIPNFGGAMENWGLIIYGEYALFYPAAYSFNKIVSVHSIIAHEYAHQWFGDLVGPEEWGYLWLNEGFATLFAAYIAERLYPEYHSSDTFINNACSAVKVGDATSRTRPMTSPVYDPEIIQNSFDDVAYSKSGCVLHMLLHAVTPQAFSDGLKIYLENRAYDVANADHLSAAMNGPVKAVPGFPANLEFKDILDSWHLQSGFPLLNVEYNRETGAITLSQKRYVTEAITDPAIWHIPYNFIASSEAGRTGFTSTKADGWFKDANLVISPSTARDWTGSDWVLFNKENTGYYRVNYDDDNWEALITALQSENLGNIPYLSRAQLIGDSLRLALNNLLDPKIALSLLQYLPAETNYFPWRNAFASFADIETKFIGSASYPYLLAYINHLTETQYPNYGIAEKNGEDPSDNYLRQTLIEWACKSGVEECLTDATDAVKANLNSGGVITSFHWNVVNTQGLRRLDSENFLKYWKRMQADADGTARNIYLNAMGATEDKVLRDTLLSTSIIANGATFEEVAVSYTSTERANILVYILNNNPESVDEIMTFVTENEAAIRLRFPDELSFVLNNIANKIKTQTRLDAYVELVKLFPDLKTATDGYVLNIEANIKWIEESGKTMEKWLEDEYGDAAAGSLFISWTLIVAATLFVRFQF